ncbi:MAG: hypothetical protein K0S57_2646 [Ramlibacter sp.]|jgi:hypothetical protein|nr:hypothetical protein [Ramlibacter sp.]
MTATLYAMCQKPVIGIALWLFNLCAFPPLLKETPISVLAPGTVLSSPFSVPVSKGYFLSARFTFPSTQERISDTLVGSEFDTPCFGPAAKRFDDFPVSARTHLGKPLRLKAIIKSRPSGSVAYAQEIASICRSGHNGAAVKTQVLSLIWLAEGNYTIEVQNVEPRPEIDALHPSLIIHHGGNK